MRIRSLILILFLFIPVISAQEDTFSLTILHTSNVYDNHEIGDDGIGGTARVASLIARARAENPGTLLLDGGDRFLNPTSFDRNADIMNELGYNAMVTGNHEFNGGNVGILNFVTALDFPIVAANIDFSGSPVLAGVIPPSIVLDVNGASVGIIGLANEETAVLSSPGPDLVFLDDEALIAQEAVDELTAQGINIIILLAHREANENAVLATTVSGVDVIVGGSDDALLSNSDENAVFSYPIETTSLTGEPVLIVQTPEGNRYFGQLTVSFDANGTLTDWSGDTTLLDDSVEEEAEIAELVEELFSANDVEAIEIGETRVDLIGGDPCREGECTMGNLIADAIRAETGTDIAIYNSGGIRASIPAGTVTDQQLQLVLPFPNTVSTLELRGSDVIAALEHGVSLGADATRSGSGRYLQVSGMRFSWDATRPGGSRIISVEISGADGNYRPIDNNTVYSVTTNDFIRQGGDEYSVLESNAIDPFDFGPLVRDTLTAYITANSPVAPEIEGRITRIDS